MAYRVLQYDDALEIRQNYRLTGMALGVLGVLALLLSLVIKSQQAIAVGAGNPAAAESGYLWPILLTFLGGGLVIVGALLVYYQPRTIINFSLDVVTTPLPRRRTIPFKEIDTLRVHKDKKLSSPALFRTLGVTEVDQWVISLKTDQGDVPLLDLYSELDVKRFLGDMNRHAAWPTEHTSHDGSPAL